MFLLFFINCSFARFRMRGVMIDMSQSFASKLETVHRDVSMIGYLLERDVTGPGRKLSVIILIDGKLTLSQSSKLKCLAADAFESTTSSRQRG